MNASKGFVGVALILILLSAQLNPGFLPMVNVDCLEDGFFTWTKSINDIVATYPSLYNSVSIVLGLSMDALAFTCFYLWTRNIHRSWTFPLALCSVYALKLFI